MTDWLPVATASNQLEAEMLCELLSRWGIPARLAPADAISFLGVSATSCRILVPAPMVEEARALLGQPEPRQAPEL